MPSPTGLLQQSVGLVMLLSGLLLPGHCLLRVWVRRPGLAASFLCSAALLMNLVLLLDALGVDFSRLSLALPLLAVCGASWPFRRREVPDIFPVGLSWRPVLPWLPAALVGLVAILYRCLVGPLSGYDHIFRWDFLALKMGELRTLSFYPAVRAEDYQVYGWCDGIAPLVSTLNYWCYLCLGGTNPVLTFWRLALEAGLLFWMAGRWSARLAGNASAGAAAMALLACCSLFLWSVAIGQETGLTALSLVCMLSFLDEEAKDGDFSTALCAGLAAGLGALAREYGLAWILLGLGLLALRRRPRSQWIAFLFAAALVCGPWYLRNWLRTGNPLWSHSLAGLFPVNPFHTLLMQDIAELYQVRGHWEAFGDTLWLLVPVCGVTLACGLAGLRRLGARSLPLILGAGLVTLLWLWSLHQTAAGWNFSKRVLGPALVLCSVAGGVTLSQTKGWIRSLLPLLVFVLALDAACRSLYLPQAPWVSLQRFGDGTWNEEGLARAEQAADPVWDRIGASCNNRGVLTDHSFVHAYFARRGVKVRPTVSPEVDFIWSPDAPVEGTLTRLRALGIRFIILGIPDPIQARGETRSRFLQGLRITHQPNASFWFVRVYDLDRPLPVAAGTPP